MAEYKQSETKQKSNVPLLESTAVELRKGGSIEEAQQRLRKVFCFF